MASYREAVAWIAEEDGAGDAECLELAHVSSMVSVALVSHVFKKDCIAVAKSIIRYRRNFLRLGPINR